MDNEVTSYGGVVVAALPLALLAATRSHDRPSEVLEDEDLSISLPRRLGLSSVIVTQIQRYETAARSGKKVSHDEFVNLLKLVLRRPDAEPILRETGALVAQRQFEKVSPSWLKLLRILPRAAVYAVIRRATRRLLRNISGSDQVTVHGNPVRAQIKKPAAALIEPPGVGCALYGAAFEELASLYLNKKAIVKPIRCASKDGDSCEWELVK
jgi:hypothetical protein